jgi:hypothetical protein
VVLKAGYAPKARPDNTVSIAATANTGTLTFTGCAGSARKGFQARKPRTEPNAIRSPKQPLIP